MQVKINGAEMLRIINRHKAKTLSSLEEINCPAGYKALVRDGMDYLRNDLINLAQSGDDR
ncbi:MAG: hypothetical protein ACN2B6_12410 [Rickettsiales bacterium]